MKDDCRLTNPRELSKDEIVEIYRKSYVTERAF
jgi:alcohol dehydrogenase class IV